MNSQISTWFEAKVQYLKTGEDGKIKNVTETYVVAAESFTEAETRFTKYMKMYAQTFSITALKIADYSEVYLTGEDLRWYKAKVSIIILDEKTGKEKRTSVKHLVDAESIDDATKKVHEAYSGMMSGYVVESVSETKIIDLIVIE